MKLSEAVKALDETIPPPHNKMVDREHLNIAIAWKEIKESLFAHRNRLCISCRWDNDGCEVDYGEHEECKKLITEGDRQNDS